jgi:nitroreductase
MANYPSIEGTFMTLLDLTPKQLLTTTRAVRKRLDLTRPVELELIHECIEIATQAPSGGNSQRWHFIVVTDAAKRKELGAIYKKAYDETSLPSLPSLANIPNTPENAQRLQDAQRNTESGAYLAEHLSEVPVIIIPCIQARSGRLENLSVRNQADAWASVMPAIWSFMLAARLHGLGSVLTTAHLIYEREKAQLLAIPYDTVTQTALIPVAYTIGTEFKPGLRKIPDEIIHINNW